MSAAMQSPTSTAASNPRRGGGGGHGRWKGTHTFFSAMARDIFWCRALRAGFGNADAFFLPSFSATLPPLGFAVAGAAAARLGLSLSFIGGAPKRYTGFGLWAGALGAGN